MAKLNAESQNVQNCSVGGKSVWKASAVEYVLKIKQHHEKIKARERREGNATGINDTKPHMLLSLKNTQNRVYMYILTIVI